MDKFNSYKTIKSPIEGELFKDKNSKFFSFAYPITIETEVQPIIKQLTKLHPNANHYCYAYQIGIGNRLNYRTNDDGEPNNSAGLPIYGQIKSFGLTNILVIVIRYFGGVKLGVSGLIKAYKNATFLALEASTIITKTINVAYKLSFSYKDMSDIQRFIKLNHIEITSQELNESCMFYINVRQGDAERIFNYFDRYYGVDIIRV